MQRKSVSEEELTEEEKEELDKGINILIEADFIETEYNPKMTIETAYEYLKTTEKYKNAENV